MVKVAEYKSIHQCIICSKSFETDNPRASYCWDCHYPKCPICNNRFYRKHSRMQSCSLSCGSVLASRQRSKTALRCHHCNKSFYPSNGHLGMKYCSQDCRYKSKRKNGSDKKRQSWHYRKWRKDVLKRDNYTCQICGSQKHLQTHHLIKWSDNIQLRYSVNNGQTVCKYCHSEIHGKPINRTETNRIPCQDCGCPITGKGKTNYCRSCALKYSDKAKAHRQSLLRNQNGQFSKPTHKNFRG